MFELNEAENQSVIDLEKYRTKTETIVKEFYSVQFFLYGKGVFYQFKLRNISPNRPYILVKKDSPVIKELRIGDIREMEYNNPQSSDASRLFRTQITSINAHSCYKGHSIVELSIMDNLGEIAC